MQGIKRIEELEYVSTGTARHSCTYRLRVPDQQIILPSRRPPLLLHSTTTLSQVLTQQ